MFSSEAAHGMAPLSLFLHVSFPNEGRVLWCWRGCAGCRRDRRRLGRGSGAIFGGWGSRRPSWIGDRGIGRRVGWFFQHLQDRVQAGIVKWNGATADAGVEAPFGGWKASGLGPAEHGPADLEFYTRAQSLYEA